MKYCIAAFFITLSIAVFAQDSKIESNDTETNAVDIGIENTFSVTGSIDSLVYNRQSLTAKLESGTLIVQPHHVGSHTIQLFRNDRTDTLVFEADYLPRIDPQFSFRSEKNVINKNKISDLDSIVWVSQPSESFLRQFPFREYQLEVGNQKLTVSGNKLPLSVLEEIRKLKSGDIVRIVSLVVKNNTKSLTFYFQGENSSYIIQ